MLDIDQDTRYKLVNNGSLIYDEEGFETLAGLNTAESQFILDFEKQIHQQGLCGETKLFLQLKHNHLTARNERVSQVSCCDTGLCRLTFNCNHLD